MPGLRTAEDANPPRLPKPTAEESKPDIRTALFGCPHRDLLPGGRKRRNLIVNLDGTSNQFSVNSTNVVELFSRIIKSGGDVEQLVYYNSGIGTYARPSFRSFSYLKQVIYNHIDTAIAWNFERIVHAAYKWLSENYEPGDRIFLFGFSRGAYQVRVIAGMIELVGLLHKGNENQIAFAYELYTAVTAHSKRASTQTAGETKRPQPTTEGDSQLPTFNSEEEELCWSFKMSLCHENVKVHFVGAWDTVSSIGVFRGKSFPETVSGMGHVCHFRHALALDERRAKFQPEYVNGGLGPIEGECRGDVKEVWFKGTHSDIGGGNIRNKYLNNFSDSLRWMTYEAQSCGLKVKPYTGKWVPVTQKESLTWFWMLLELIPFGALSYTDEDSLTWWPHLGKPRKIQPGQLIHQSVLGTLTPNLTMEILDLTSEIRALETRLSYNKEILGDNLSVKMPGAYHVRAVPKAAPLPYYPKALLHPSFQVSEWSDLFSQYSPFQNSPIIEPDPFENASHILNSLSQACDGLISEEEDPGPALNTLIVGMQTLQSFLDDPTRLSSLFEVPGVEDILLKTMMVVVLDTTIALSRGSKQTLVRLFARAWPASKEIPINVVPRIPPSEVARWGLDLRKSHRDDLLKVLQPFALLSKQQNDGSSWDQAVVILATNPTQVIFTTQYSLSSDEYYVSVSIWDTSIQRAKEVVQCKGERSVISCDGSHVAVVDGREVSIINTTKPHSVIRVTDDEEEHTADSEIACLCFAENQQTLASGHKDGWIKLWHRNEDDQWKVFKRFEGARSNVWGLAFSMDSLKLAFRAEQIAGVWKWDSEDGEVIPLVGSYNSRVLAWSPSGDGVAVGASNGWLNIVNPNSGHNEHRFKAHDDWISCLEFRRDGQMLVTGSYDCRVRVWRCDTWEKMWDLDIGLWVSAVAFSPNGRRLVTVSGVGGMAFWDVDIRDSEGAG
ncbi:hypothetical protein ONZ45_g11841 [Pleurotus djamor]|nr:hypothetical protein ONZ45_g11841 [Pleurotus djamor]